jgi:preprotein translocase subunit SecD
MKALVTYVPPLAFALLLGAITAPAAQRRAPRDRGGTSLLLEVKAEASRLKTSVARTAVVIRRRCARLRVYCHVRPQAGDGATRLVLRFSTTSDSGRVKRILLAEGMEVRAVVSPPNPEPTREYWTRAEAVAAAGAGGDVFPFKVYGKMQTYIVTERAPIVTGDDVLSAEAVRTSDGTFDDVYEVNYSLRRAGGARLKAWTSANVGRYVAVVFDGRVVSAPYIKSPIWLDVVISGNFERRDAEDLAIALSAGNLPARVEMLEEKTYRR